MTADFIVVGFDQDPAEITRLLGVPPDDLGKQGEERVSVNRGRVYTVKDSYWQLRIVLSPASYYLEAYILALLARVEPLAGGLAKLPPHVLKKIVIQASVAEGGSIPGLYLEPEVVARLAALGLAIDIAIN